MLLLWLLKANGVSKRRQSFLAQCYFKHSLSRFFERELLFYLCLLNRCRTLRSSLPKNLDQRAVGGRLADLFSFFDCLDYGIVVGASIESLEFE